MPETQKRPPDLLEGRIIYILIMTASLLFFVLLYLNHRDAVHVTVVPLSQMETAS